MINASVIMRLCNTQHVTVYQWLFLKECLYNAPISVKLWGGVQAYKWISNRENCIYQNSTYPIHVRIPPTPFMPRSEIPFIRHVFLPFLMSQFDHQVLSQNACRTLCDLLSPPLGVSCMKDPAPPSWYACRTLLRLLTPPLVMPAGPF